MIQFAIYTAYGGSLIADYSTRVQGLSVATNDRGYAECSGFVPMGLAEAFLLYDRPGLPHVRVSDSSSGAVYEGRLEDVAIVDGGVQITALGYSRSLGDTPYTALWSDTSVSGWRPVLDTEVAGMFPSRFQFDTNNRLFITPQKNSTQGNTPIVGALTFAVPYGSSRLISGISFDYTLVAPANWTAQLISQTETFGSRAAEWTLASAGPTQTGTKLSLPGTARARLEFSLYYNAAAAVSGAETGDIYLKITNLRIVTATTNRVNTTLGTNIAAGTRTVTPGSMTNIYVGQSLQIDQGSATVGESVTVTAITSTTFTAVFAFAHVTTSTVNAHVIYADEIARDLIGTITALNSAQLESSTALVQSPAIDLTDEVYEDRSPSDVLDYLTGLGDTQSRAWEWGVFGQQLLSFRPQSSASRTWYTDVSSLDVTRTLDQLYNSVYAVYSDASGRSLRTSPTADSTSIARYGVTRRQAISAQTTSATLAGVEASASLSDTNDPRPRSGLTLTQVFDAGGARWPLWSVQAGDTIVIRNLPPTLSTAIDRIRVFRLTRADYHFDDDTLDIEPETPRATLDSLLARLALGTLPR